MTEQSFLEINPEQFKAFVQLPMNTPVVMLNLLKFKDMVSETGLSGPEDEGLWDKVLLVKYNR